MITLIDSSLWVDFTRPQSPRRLKQFVAPHILHPTAHLAEPVVFEVLRHALPAEVGHLRRQFETVPMLSTPGDLWDRATELGQLCRRKGHTAGAVDLLITAVAMAHRAVMVTLDDDFEKIGKIVGLEVKLLHRPVGGGS